MPESPFCRGLIIFREGILSGEAPMALEDQKAGWERVLGRENL